MQQEKDKQLWRLAKKRVGFRNHIAMYIVCNMFFLGVWFFTGRPLSEEGFPWPVFPMFGWGVGILFHFLSAFVFVNKLTSIEREYEKLKNKTEK